MHRKITAGLFIAAVFLTGCSSANEEESKPKDPNAVEYTEVTDAKEISVWKERVDDEQTFEPAGDLVVKGDTAAWILTGSGSCPPEIEQVVFANNSIDVHLDASGHDKACTADAVSYVWKTELEQYKGAEVAFGRVITGATKNPLTFTRLPANG